MPRKPKKPEDWTPPKIERTRMVTELYYYKLTVSHHDADFLREVALLIQAKYPKQRVMNLYEIHHLDGTETETEMPLKSPDR